MKMMFLLVILRKYFSMLKIRGYYNPETNKPVCPICQEPLDATTRKFFKWFYNNEEAILAHSVCGLKISATKFPNNKPYENTPS